MSLVYFVFVRCVFTRKSTFICVSSFSCDAPAQPLVQLPSRRLPAGRLPKPRTTTRSLSGPRSLFARKSAEIPALDAEHCKLSVMQRNMTT